jgi:hypothetical protein
MALGALGGHDHANTEDVIDAAQRGRIIRVEYVTAESCLVGELLVAPAPERFQQMMAPNC